MQSWFWRAAHLIPNAGWLVDWQIAVVGRRVAERKKTTEVLPTVFGRRLMLT